MIRILFGLFIGTAIAAPALAQAEFTVQLEELHDRKAVFGTVQSVDVVNARARIGGTVSGLAVDEGADVDGGQTIARVEDPKLSLQLAAIDARIRSLDAQRKLAQLELARLEKLRKSGAVSQARLDEARTNVTVITGSRAALVAERAVIEQQVAEGAVLAPTAGRILRVAVTEGSVVMPGETVAVVAAERYVLRMELPERHARFIREGDAVQVGDRNLGRTGTGKLREGRIDQVYPEMTHGRVVADVVVDGLGDFFIGERTRVYVSAGARQAIVVPAEYLRQRFGVTYALVKGEGEVMVQPGQSLEDRVEVLSGLQAGDVLLKP